MSKNNKPDKQSVREKRVKAFPAWASMLIVVISILEVVFIIGLFILFIINDIPPSFFEKAAESSLLASGIAIVGIAIAVWAGLNIANAIERKDYSDFVDKTEKRVLETEEELNGLQEKYTSIIKKEPQWKKERFNSEKAELIGEISSSINDAASRQLIKLISSCSFDMNISILKLIEMERLFNIVFSRHTNKYKSDIKLIELANDGIRIAEEQLKKVTSPAIKTYLQYRIADFCYYKGYCIQGPDREQAFLCAIDGYEKTYRELGAYVPCFISRIEYPIKSNEYEGCSTPQLGISAYVCNSIGDAYSKIVEDKEKCGLSDKELKEYSEKAIFYCAYAAHWENCGTYWRNLGCAIERSCGVTKETYDAVFDAYNNAHSIKATPNTFKVLLSCIEKRIAIGLGIERVDNSVGRIPPVSDRLYYDHYQQNDDSEREVIKTMLKQLHNTAIQAKTLYPSDTVGYAYECFYYRDICIICRDNGEKIEKNLAIARENYELLNALDPNSELTRMLRDDLNAFKQL